MYNNHECYLLVLLNHIGALNNSPGNLSKTIDNLFRKKRFFWCTITCLIPDMIGWFIKYAACSPVPYIF
jgi:hypothetical protein